MIAGGGTGGHIYPAIAIAREFIARDPKRRAVFVGTERGLEKTIVPKAGFPLELISAAGLQGKGALDRLRGLVQLPIGFTQAFRLIGKHRPVAVLGVGGYSSGPVLAAAKLRGVPTIIHEQNAFPGLTNRLLAKFVKAVAVAFPEAASRLNRSDAIVTGNPIRAEFFEASGTPASSPARTGGDAGAPPSHGSAPNVSLITFFTSTSISSSACMARSRKPSKPTAMIVASVIDLRLREISPSMRPLSWMIVPARASGSKSAA